MCAAGGLQAGTCLRTTPPPLQIPASPSGRVTYLHGHTEAEHQWSSWVGDDILQGQPGTKGAGRGAWTLRVNGND